MRENTYIHWYGTGDVFFYGKPNEICTGLCGILTGACKFLNTDLESLITAVYTAMQETDPDCISIKTVLEKKDAENSRTVVRFDRDGYTELNGPSEEIMAAVTALVYAACKKLDMPTAKALTVLHLGLSMMDEKESAPADGSSTGAEEGIT